MTDQQKPERKVVQIAAIPCGNNSKTANDATVIALCDDGTLWALSNDGWSKFRPIPQDGSK